MRWAIISDIHADAASLRLVLKDAAKAGARRTICLGDVVGYGPEPAAAVALVRADVDVCLMGNHDAAVAKIRSTSDFQPVAALAAKRHAGMLSPGDAAWLLERPYMHVEKTSGGAAAFACAHGDFLSPGRFNYVIEPQDAMPSLAVREERLLFVGHTHDPGVFALGPDGVPVRMPPRSFKLREGCRYVVNPGSTGYPRHGECESSYCVYDDTSQTVEFRTIPFDIEGYCARMDAAGMPKASWLEPMLEERKAERAAAKPAAAKIRISAPAALAAAALAASAAALGVAAHRLLPRAKDAGTGAGEAGIAACAMPGDAGGSDGGDTAADVPLPAPLVAPPAFDLGGGWTARCDSGVNPSAVRTPDGQVMLSADGEGEFTLSAKLALDPGLKPKVELVVEDDKTANRGFGGGTPAIELEFLDAEGNVLDVQERKRGSRKKLYTPDAESRPGAVFVRANVKVALKDRFTFGRLSIALRKK